MRTQWIVAFIVMVFSGCTAGADMTPKDKPSTASTSSVPATLLADAKADAAKRTGKSDKEITVVSAERVSWSDASMGCPAPGMMYAQVIVPGYRIILRVGDEQLD